MAKKDSKGCWEEDGNDDGSLRDRSIVITRCVNVLKKIHIDSKSVPKKRYSLASRTSDTSVREPAEFTNAIRCLSISIDIDMFPRLIQVHIMHNGNFI